MDTLHRIIDFKLGGPALLMHCDHSYAVQGYQLNPPYDSLRLFPGFFKDSSSNNHLIVKYDIVDPPYEYENAKIVSGGRFSSCIRGRAGAGYKGLSPVFWPHHDAFNFDYGDFTIEFLFKADKTLTSKYWLHVGEVSTILRYPMVGRIIQFGIYEKTIGTGPTSYNVSRMRCLIQQEVGDSIVSMEMWGATNPTPMEWHHCALVKREQSMFMYLAGALEGSMSLDGSPHGMWDRYTSPSKFPSDPDLIDRNEINADSTIYTMADDYHSLFIKADWDQYAYIDELRIIKGAQYTGPFTPPTEPYQ